MKKIRRAEAHIMVVLRLAEGGASVAELCREHAMLLRRKRRERAGDF